MFYKRKIASKVCVMLFLTMCVFTKQIYAAEEIFENWTVGSSKNPITDAVTVIAQTDEMNGANGVYLAVGCQASTAAFLYGLGGYMGGGVNDVVQIRYRFDDKPASPNVDWPLSRNNRNVTILGAQAASFASQLRTGSTLVISATDPTDGEVRTHYFSLAGAVSAFENLDCLLF